MASVELTTLSGSPRDEKFRYYVCELKWNVWECAKSEAPSAPHTLSKGALCSQLIPIANWTPKFFDPLVLGYKLKKPILITNVNKS
jgi:hypothetical protein